MSDILSHAAPHRTGKKIPSETDDRLQKESAYCGIV